MLASTRPCRVFAGASAFGCSLVFAWPAPAQVTEPDGKVVPGPSSQSGETSLSAYFASVGEPIDAVMEANTEPAVFSPSCGFEASLVLSQSGNQSTGMAWYNVPADPTAAPDAVYPIVPAGSPLGQAFSSADFRASPNYTGGLIGFVLFTGADDTRVYYSESKRNVFCSACATPGYWQMMLAYRSKLLPDTYYLAFEDWGGADATSNPNDDDFNDKVFKLHGVSCAGGGVPCTTTLMGACAAGLTECLVGAAVTCQPEVKPSAETCDNVDNDCNGSVDDGSSLCPESEICVRGRCVAACGNSEFTCVSGYVCQNGYCVDAACKDRACPAGLACRNGACVDPCAGAICPVGQECQAGRCVDLCAGVTCPGGVCDRGVCVGTCDCDGCPAGRACAAGGGCVDPGCETRKCGAGDVCVKGACQNSCAGVLCPGGALCRAGVCDTPSVDTTAEAGTPVFIGQPSGPDPVGAGAGGSASADAGVGRGAAGRTSGDGTVATGGAPNRVAKATCSCRTAASAGGSRGPLLCAFATLAVVRRRRARRQRRRLPP